jgi:hypothetical protein
LPLDFRFVNYNFVFSFIKSMNKKQLSGGKIHPVVPR